jgi:hypothetical protein
MLRNVNQCVQIAREINMPKLIGVYRLLLNVFKVSFTLILLEEKVLI